MIWVSEYFRKTISPCKNGISALRTCIVEGIVNCLCTCFQTLLSGIRLRLKHNLTVEFNDFASLQHGFGVT